MPWSGLLEHFLLAFCPNWARGAREREREREEERAVCVCVCASHGQRRCDVDIGMDV